MVNPAKRRCGGLVAARFAPHLMPMTDTGITISPGFLPAQRGAAAQLFWNAFGAKLGEVMGPEHLALTFVSAVADPAHAISAQGPDGALMGLAGFKTATGGFIGGGLTELAATYGWLGTAWRAPILALLERDLAADTLLMDGIFVAPNARGKGIGTALLKAIKLQAVQRGLSKVRLDVIDSNPRAKALYTREGFVAGEVQHLGPLRHIFGFRHATTMIWHDCTAAS
jgi:GNAT superfamily N-acetyltransferase